MRKFVSPDEFVSQAYFALKDYQLNLWELEHDVVIEPNEREINWMKEASESTNLMQHLQSRYHCTNPLISKVLWGMSEFPYIKKRIEKALESNYARDPRLKTLVGKTLEEYEQLELKHKSEIGIFGRIKESILIC